MYRGERLNSISHLIGAALALAGLVILVVIAAMKGDPWKIVSFSVYGGSLFTLYSFSTLYHSFRGKVKSLFRKLDHAAIYLLIAGTYTPFALVTLRGERGWVLFGVIWALAIAGAAQDLYLKQRKEVLSVTLYLVMGWLALTVLKPLSTVLTASGMFWLIAGGVLYSIGAAFYILEKRLKYGHAIFHFFVLAGSISHFFTVLLAIA